MYKKVYIAAALRSPIGSFGGALSALSAPEIASIVIKATLDLAKISPSDVNEVILGSVLTAGQGQAPARQAAIKAGIPDSVPAATINKVCSSGLYSSILAARSIELGISDVVIAGGMESMSNVPYYIPALRNGARLGNTEVTDGIIKDGLWDVYNNYHMGNAGELCAETFGLTREIQDTFALESYRKAKDSIKNKLFDNEICPIKIETKKGSTIFSTDEEPGNLIEEKVRTLKPVFKKDGTITAANASSLNDGAAILVMVSENALNKMGLTPIARVISEGLHSQAPEWFTTAPVGALKAALSNAKLNDVSKLDAVEINEAFSSVALSCTKELSLNPEIVNQRGGAVALGHPIGASGARILVTLLGILSGSKGKFGGVSICNGGGEATSMIIERV
ncbi:MAG TPA: acetyl-CoA C-acyltransferase [Oligoflexia bacterium]|nr:acetyl-CoA C-acyltransferase [Oligoflexia bacterium]HMP48399.1 acetyl-CoA C-acyltransferase [Oligoflexia bacterium]